MYLASMLKEADKVQIVLHNTVRVRIRSVLFLTWGKSSMNCIQFTTKNLPSSSFPEDEFIP